MGDWPTDKLLRHGPGLPMAERIRRNQHNIREIGAARCAVPTSAMIDSLDPAEIELWFAGCAYRIHRLGNAVTPLASEASDPAEK